MGAQNGEYSNAMKKVRLRKVIMARMVLTAGKRRKLVRTEMMKRKSTTTTLAVSTLYRCLVQKSCARTSQVTSWSAAPGAALARRVGYDGSNPVPRKKLMGSRSVHGTRLRVVLKSSEKMRLVRSKIVCSWKISSIALSGL